MRLFEKEANAPEPNDLAEFYEGVTDSAELEINKHRADWQRHVLIAMCISQIIAGVAGFFEVYGWTNQTMEVRLIQATLGLIAVSGLIGVTGAVKRHGDILQWFFITQIWSLSTVFSQFIAQQQTNKRQGVFCDTSKGHSICDGDHSALMALGLFSAIVVVYLSMFFADGLAEHLQDKCAARLPELALVYPSDPSPRDPTYRAPDRV